ncbi:putative disease resistance RPP13-like protein 1 [Camellia lanceoleosa]|uniref:Disease resistance RPP13-like protein 1 n=1 Tax=Camellia lanceoleosa TaxID=1840588 RepID=A0ACC0GRW4_9ERIC|nr:putative disease resistance RPP13-like protein 1 [Camellia lanceoleosa]
MTVSVLISAAQVILNPLIPLATEQIKLAWGFKDDLRRLKDRLEFTQALLRDAENHRGRVNLEIMQVWLKKLNSVACSADDVLDELAFEVLRRKMEVQNRFMRNNKVRKSFFFCLSNPLPFRFKMANKVKNINFLLDNLCKDADGFGLKPAADILNAASPSVEPREVNFRLTHPFLDDKQEKLPKKFCELVRLRHFCIGDNENNRKLMPMMIGKLTSLQTLPFFVVGEDEGQKIEELGSLSKLRGKLIIYNLQQVKSREEADKAKILGKPNICKLGFYWDRVINPSTAGDTTSINHEDVLEGLKPHGNLKGLKLQNFEGKSFASWMMSGRDAQLLQNLVTIELSKCTRCEQVPPLGHLPHLEVIKMSELSNLKHIGPEFYGCHSVVNHDQCKDGIITGSYSGAVTTATTKAMAVVFPALRELHLEYMPNIEEWCGLGVSSSSSDTTMFFPLLKSVIISDCPELTTIPGHLLSLQELICNDYRRDNPHTHRPYLRIEVSRASNSKIGVLLVDLLEKSGKTLRKLTVSESVELCYLPINLQNLSSLEDLTINQCPNLKSIIKETEEKEEEEEEEEASNCSGLTSLQQLRISRCSELTLPKGLLQQTLVRLEISWCPNLIIADPDELCNLPSLQSLTIQGCPRLAGWWEERLFCQTSLQKLTIGIFSEELEYFPWPSTTVRAEKKVDDDDTKYHPNPKHYPFISLVSLTLYGWERLKYLPDQLQHLTTLRDLSLVLFDGLEALPEWLGNLSSLHSLQLWGCTNLMNLPTLEAMQRLTNLQSLEIHACPLLKERCARESGQEWHKIAHIPSIFIIHIYDVFSSLLFSSPPSPTFPMLFARFLYLITDPILGFRSTVMVSLADD